MNINFKSFVEAIIKKSSLSESTKIAQQASSTIKSEFTPILGKVETQNKDLVSNITRSVQTSFSESLTSKMSSFKSDFVSFGDNLTTNIEALQDNILTSISSYSE